MGCCEKKKPDQLLDKSVQGSKDQIITDEKDTKLDEELINKEQEPDQALNVKVTYNDFEPIKLLAKGSFDEVFLVRLKANKKVYAMKILNKNILKIKKQELHTKTERDLMVKINCPFIVNIKSAFQDTTKLYIVSEFMQGGDMFFHLHDGK